MMRYIQILLLCLCLGAAPAFLLAQETESKNLLVNADFEEGEMDEWVGRIVPGWRIIGRNAKYIKPYVHLDSEITFSGERTLRIESKSIKDGEGRVLYSAIHSSNIPVEAGCTYEYSVWIKADRPGLKGSLVIDGWVSGSARLHWWRSQRFSFDSEWKKYSITGTIPAEGEAKYLPQRKTVYVRVDMLEDGIIWVDNARLEEMGGASPLPAAAQTSEPTYTYIPEDKVGDFWVSMDAMRHIVVSWKGTNILGDWLDFYTPDSIGLKTKNWAGPYATDDPIRSYLFHRDIPVSVKRDGKSVEYLWSHSYVFADYDNKKTVIWFPPEKNMSTVRKSDFRQINRLRIEKDKITAESMLEFDRIPKEVVTGSSRKPAEQIFLFPVLFPGKKFYYKKLRETLILDQKCSVTHKNGETKDYIYPKESETFPWLTNEPRDLVFDVAGKGKIRFHFSFSDPDTSLLFYGHAGCWGTLYGLPAVVGRIIMPVKKGFRDGKYRCVIKMDILTGERINEEVTPAKKRFAEDPINVFIESPNTCAIYLDKEPLKFNIRLDSSDTNPERKVEIEQRVVDYSNRELYKKKGQATIVKGFHKNVEVILPSFPKGIYVLEVKIFEKGNLVGYRNTRFSVLDKPNEYPAEKGFFGCAIRLEGPGEYSKKALEVARAIGIKRFRWGPNGLSWGEVEKSKGEFKFHDRFDTLIKLAKEYNLNHA